MIRLRKIIGFFTFPVLVLVIHIFSLSLNFYRLFPWLGIPMHFFGGAGVGYTFILFLDYFEEEKYLKLNRFFEFVFIVSLVALIAVFWEFFEFGLTHFSGMSFQGDLNDTLADLLLGIVGGVFVALFRVLPKDTIPVK